MNGYEQEHKVFAAIQDEQSKRLYEGRCLLSLTGDQRFLYEFLSYVPEVMELKEKSRMRKAYIFGCGEYGIIIMHLLQEDWVGFLDNSGERDTFLGLPVLKPGEETLVKDNSVIYITPKYYHREIREQLLQLGYSEDRLVNVGKILAEMMERQYFDLAALDLDCVDTFYDIGSFDGMTSKIFLDRSNNKGSKSICFEPERDNIEKIKKILGTDYIDRYVLIEKGAWSSEKTLSFREDGWASSFDDSGTVKVPVTAIDNVASDEDGICMIKMDIEGAEYEALRGAENTIRAKKPFLAISVYHKPEDIIELPKLVLSYYPNYKLYFRHYTMGLGDTVMYAIP